MGNLIAQCRFIVFNKSIRVSFPEVFNLFREKGAGLPQNYIEFSKGKTIKEYLKSINKDKKLGKELTSSNGNYSFFKY